MQTYQLAKRLNDAGLQLAGGKAYFRIAGTTTAAVIYTDPDLTEEHAYPIVADASGNFPETVYFTGTDTLRLDIIASDGDLATPLVQSEQINVPQSAGTIDGGDITEATIPGSALEPGAIEDYLGFTPQEDLTNLTATAKNALLDRIGVVFPYFGTAAPAGALKCNGGTIGSAASGAASASDSYAALYALLWAWAAADSPILTSAGAGSTRGASAAADFAANKRLTLPDLRGEFIRGLDDSRAIDTARAIGSAQVEMVGPHDHTVNHATSNGSSNDTTANGGAMTDATTAAAVDWVVNNNTGTENRPRNVALLYAVWF
jgi:hypothetical protein